MKERIGKSNTMSMERNSQGNKRERYFLEERAIIMPTE
jgi:hypothetical protein